MHRGAASSGMKDQNASGPPLAGLTVIDCGQVVAGPMVAMLLGDFGADVIKIEHPVGGDPVRAFGRSRDDVPLFWQVLGRNKRSITLALNTERGQELFRRLVAATQADVVVESFRPGTLERWGLDYETLSALDPGLILARISGFGQTGPYRQRLGFGTLAEAMSGLAGVTGEANGPPTLPPIPLADSVAALYATIGTLIAIHHRERDPRGRGQVVDASLLESLFSLLSNQLVEFDQLGHVARRNGSRAPTSAPRNLYPTADGGWIAIAAPTNVLVVRLFRAIGQPHLADEPRFATHEGRLEHVEELDDIVSAWTSRHDLGSAVETLIAAEVPAAPVTDIAQLAVDPHLLERQAVTSVETPELGPVRMPGVLPRLSETAGSIRLPAPPIGNANRDVYRDLLGLSEAECGALHEAGVI